MTEEDFYLVLLVGAALALGLTRRVRTAWYRKGTTILGTTWIIAVLVFWNIDARCSGSLIFSYRNCRLLDDETSQIMSMIAVALLPLVGLIWMTTTFVFLVQLVRARAARDS